MFEIETKFSYTSETREKLSSVATFIKTQSLHDIYFDNGSFDLMHHDTWLRKRDGNWEIKIPQHKLGTANTRTYDNYLEIEGEQATLTHLGLSGKIEKHYSPQVEFVTKRDTCSIDGLTVVFDEADFGHHVGEVEVIIEDKKMRKWRMKKLHFFVKSMVWACIAYEAKFLNI